MGYIASTRSSIHEPKRVGQVDWVSELKSDISGRSRVTVFDIMASTKGERVMKDHF